LNTACFIKTLYNVSLSKLLIKQDLNTHYNFVMKNLRQHREHVNP
jgi:hypothetical protein